MMIKDKILVYGGKKLICFSHILIAVVYKFFLFFFSFDASKTCCV